MNNKMATNTYLSTIESNHKNKINTQAKQKNHRYREHFDSYKMGRGSGGWAKKGEGIKKYKLVVIE